MKTLKINTRVIAGTKRGTKLVNPETGTRPLTDRIKMSLFDLIKTHIKGARILDLYAGGGNFGIEALSRGAMHATFIDLGNEAVNCISQNLEKTNLVDQATIIRTTVEDFVRETQEDFDIIMTDPPFNRIIIEHIIDSSKVLKKGGVFVFRHPKQFEAPQKLGNLTEIYSKKYGVSTISFYQ